MPFFLTNFALPYYNRPYECGTWPENGPYHQWYGYLSALLWAITESQRSSSTFFLYSIYRFQILIPGYQEFPVDPVAKTPCSECRAEVWSLVRELEHTLSQLKIPVYATTKTQSSQINFKNKKDLGMFWTPIQPATAQNHRILWLGRSLGGSLGMGIPYIEAPKYIC